MPEQNATNGVAKPTVRMGLELELTCYTITNHNPPGATNFEDYYHKTIHDWLQKNNVASTRAWIVKDQLFILSTPGMPPWSSPVRGQGIEDLNKYLNPTPVAITPLLTLNLHPQEGWQKLGSENYEMPSEQSLATTVSKVDTTVATVTTNDTDSSANKQ